jgi:Uma2 family endonuclease
MASITGLTIEDFESLPAALARNHELVDGELVDVSGNTLGHNEFRDELGDMLRAYVREHKLGRVVAEQEFQFGENAHGPDVAFVGLSKLGLLHQGRRVQLFVPDLAIEVISTNDKFAAVEAKALRYIRYGTREVYVFSLDSRRAYRFSEAGDQVLRETDEFRPETIPGFAIRIADLFALI